MTGLRRLFHRKRTLSLHPRTTSTASANQAPSPEDQVQYDPPPYYASTGQGDQNPAAQTVVPQETISQGLLDPNLNFMAAQMEAQWRAKDKLFAKAIVQFIAERFDGNLKGWAGYKYTYICEVRFQNFLLVKQWLTGARMKIPSGRSLSGMIYWGTTRTPIGVGSDRSVP